MLGLVQRCTRGQAVTILNVEDPASLEKTLAALEGAEGTRDEGRVRLSLASRPLAPSLEREDAASGREVDGLGAAIGAELCQDRRDVELDGVIADREALGDRLVGQADGDQRQHLALSCRQVVDLVGDG